MVVMRRKLVHRHRFTIVIGTEHRPYAERKTYACAYPGCMKLKTGKWRRQVPPK